MAADRGGAEPTGRGDRGPVGCGWPVAAGLASAAPGGTPGAGRAAAADDSTSGRGGPGSSVIIAARPAGRAAAVRPRGPEGRRRATLYGAARGIARMVAAGALTEPAARAALEAAGTAAQQTPREIRAAINGVFADEGAAA